MEPTSRESALAYLRSHHLGTLATLSGGAPHARSVYYAVDEDFSIHFFTLSSTRKFNELERDARSAFVVSSEQPPMTVQIEGEIENLTENAVVDAPMVQALSRQLLSYGLLSAPLSHLDPGAIAYYKLVPQKIRFSDFSKGYGTNSVAVDIPV